MLYPLSYEGVAVPAGASAVSHAPAPDLDSKSSAVRLGRCRKITAG